MLPSVRGLTLVSLPVQVKTLPVTNSSQIAAIGYCLGGSAIIELARAYPNGTDGLLGEFE
jgi:dienelactone hydrolase